MTPLNRLPAPPARALRTGQGGLLKAPPAEGKAAGPISRRTSLAVDAPDILSRIGRCATAPHDSFEGGPGRPGFPRESGSGPELVLGLLVSLVAAALDSDRATVLGLGFPGCCGTGEHQRGEHGSDDESAH